MECKGTSSTSMVLKLSWILKIIEEAVKGGMEGWVLQIEFIHPLGANQKHAVVAKRWFDPYRDRIKVQKWEKVLTTAASLRVNKEELNNRCVDVTFQDGDIFRQYVILPWIDYVVLLEQEG